MKDYFDASGIRFVDKSDDDIKLILNSEHTVNVYDKYVGFLNDSDINMLIDDYRNAGYGNIYYELSATDFQS